MLVGGGLGREFFLRRAQGFGFLGAEALQLGADALLDLELEGLQAGDVGLEKEAFELEWGGTGWWLVVDGRGGDSAMSDLVAGLEGFNQALRHARLRGPGGVSVG